mgnify:CR=1 FL=1
MDACYALEDDEVEAGFIPVSYTHLRAHETVLDIVCRLLLEKKQHAEIPVYLCKHDPVSYITPIDHSK